MGAPPGRGPVGPTETSVAQATAADVQVNISHLRDDLKLTKAQQVLFDAYVDKVFTGGSDSTLPNPNPRVVITDDIPYHEYFYLRRNFPGYFSFLL